MKDLKKPESSLLPNPSLTHFGPGKNNVKITPIEIVSSNILPTSTIQEEKSLNIIMPTSHTNIPRTSLMNYLSPEQNQRMTTVESTVEFEDSVNENKEEILTMILKTHLNSKVFSSGKNMHLNPKIKQRSPMKRRNLTVSCGRKDSHVSTNDQSAISSRPQQFASETMERISNPPMFSPSSQKSSLPLKQQSLKELDDIFDGDFSDNEEEDEYDKLNKTLKINFEDNLFVNPLTRIKVADKNELSITKPEKITSKVSEGGAFASILSNKKTCLKFLKGYCRWTG